MKILHLNIKMQKIYNEHFNKITYILNFSERLLAFILIEIYSKFLLSHLPQSFNKKKGLYFEGLIEANLKPIYIVLLIKLITHTI